MNRHHTSTPRHRLYSNNNNNPILILITTPPHRPSRNIPSHTIVCGTAQHCPKVPIRHLDFHTLNPRPPTEKSNQRLHRDLALTKHTLCTQQVCNELELAVCETKRKLWMLEDEMSDAAEEGEAEGEGARKKRLTTPAS
jgi:hypothetical protein